ncbi:MAG TPA: AAA family ATPase, partial [Polyangiaceae bacterium]
MIFRFGEHEWDEELFELRCGDQLVTAPRRVLQTIGYLIRHRARAVSREELRQNVWKGTQVVDGALNQTIMLARKALGDEGERQRFIKTVRGVGFRFVAVAVERATDTRPRTADGTPELPSVEERHLIGREPELSHLCRRLARAAEGRGGLALLEGEPGIGKTSLVSALAKHAEQGGAHVFWGRAWDEGGAPAFWPWSQVLRAMVRRYGSEHLRSADGPADGMLVALISESAGLPVEPPAARSPEASDAAERFRLFDSLLGVLRRAARCAAGNGNGTRPPLLLVLEDLHAADEPTVQLLRFVAPELGDMPLLLVATLRDLEVSPDGALSALRAKLPPGAERVAVRGLGADSVKQLLGREVGERVPERVAEQVNELSLGNPLMIEELARQCRARGGGVDLVQSLSVPVPERVKRSVQKRVQQLPPATQKHLSVACALGRDFSVEALSGLAGVDETRLLGDLGPALTQGMLHEVPASAGRRLGFAHSLVREALYAALSAVERVALHRRIGERLEERAGAGEVPLFELAHHFYLASPAGGAEKAREYSLKAAQRAEGMLAHATAAVLYDQTVALTDGAASERALYERLLEAGDAWYRSGEPRAARDRYAQAAHVARAAADSEGLGWAVVWYTRASFASAWIDARLVELVQDALRRLPPGDSALKAMLLAWAPVRVNAMGPKELRKNIARESLEMARRVGDPFALGSTLGIVCWLLAGVVPREETRALATELIDVGRAAGNDLFVLTGLQRRMTDHVGLGDFASAQGEFAEYCALAEAGHHAAPLYWALVMRAYEAERLGQFQIAEERALQAFRWGERIQETWAEPIHALQTMQLRLNRGLPVEPSEGLAAAFPADAPRSRAGRLLVAMGTGDFESAHRLYSELAAEGFEQLSEDWYLLPNASIVVHYAYRIGDRAHAQQLCDLLLPFETWEIVVHGTMSYGGPVSRLLALLCVCLGDTERAAEYFDRAIEQCTHARARPRLAETLLEYAKLLLGFARA